MFWIFLGVSFFIFFLKSKKIFFFFLRVGVGGMFRRVARFLLPATARAPAAWPAARASVAWPLSRARASAAEDDDIFRIAERAGAAAAAPAGSAEPAAGAVDSAPAAVAAAGGSSVRVFRRNVQGSMRKVAPLLNQIRGLSYSEAQAQLHFSTMRAARTVARVVEQARIAAETRHGMRPDRLVVDEMYATKGKSRAKPAFHSRGRMSLLTRPYMHLVVGVREVPWTPGEKRLGKFVRHSVRRGPAAAAQLASLPLQI